MKKIFISGATGFIGSKLAMHLAEKGNRVHALYRSQRKIRFIEHKNIHLFKGDITDINSLRESMEGCSEAYHVAAFAGVWTPDPSTIYHLNITGGVNVIRAACEAGVEKIVVTSTAGVLGSSQKGEINEETHPDGYFLHYEHSKTILESVLKAISERGVHIVIVNPARVYGPGILSESNGVTRIIKSYLAGKWRITPGDGKSIGNYVFIDDVVEGHILAMEHGRKGERYILGGENADFRKFFHILSKISGKNYRLFHLPVFIMIFASHIMLFFAKITGRSPLIIPALARKYSKNFNLNIEKAKKELGYAPLGLEEGIKKTIEWLKK